MPALTQELGKNTQEGSDQKIRQNHVLKPGHQEHSEKTHRETRNPESRCLPLQNPPHLSITTVFDETRKSTLSCQAACLDWFPMVCISCARI